MENAFGQPQTIVVLGGTSDIARAITRKLCAARAHTVVLAGRDETRLTSASDEAREYGASRTETVMMDATRADDAARVVGECFERASEPVDLVIVAVGQLGEHENIKDSPEAAIEMLTVNELWPVAALTEVRRRLVAQGRGRILVLSSVAAVRVRHTAYLYGGAKAGLDRLCYAMGESLRGTGVTLQLVRPGVVRTKMTKGQPDQPFTTGPNEVAEYVVRGLEGTAPVIWSPPILRYVFFVLVHVPGRVWRLLAER